MKKVKITAVRRVQHSDLMARYENPIEHTCDVCEGQTWTSVEGRCPDGLCPEAWKTMREFVQALARGEGYPESDFERNAPTAECTFAANGDLVLEGVASGEGRELYAYFYDATGTLWPIRHVTEPDADGRYRFVIPAATWDHDERLKPAWVRLQRDIHNTWRFPDTPPTPWRLRLDAPFGDRFARLKVK